MWPPTNNAVDIQKATVTSQRRRHDGVRTDKAARLAAEQSARFDSKAQSQASQASQVPPSPGAASRSAMRLPPKLVATGLPGTQPHAAAGGHSPTASMTPSSARKRTFDVLIATEMAAATTPPQSPSRTLSSLSGSSSSTAAPASSASSHDVADAYRPTLYAAFLSNVFAESSPSTPSGSSKRSSTSTHTTSYHQLIAQFRISTQSRPSGSGSISQLGHWLSALTHHVSKLDHRTHSELVEAILAIPWPTLGPAISRAWTTFVCSLLSARAEWLGAVLEHSVRALGYHSDWHELPLAAAPSYTTRTATRRQVYARVHALLRSLLSLIPTLPTTLFPLLLSHLPPKRSPLRTQGLFILNLLRVTEYAPELTEGVWAAVVHRVMSIDVEVQMEVEDLEDESGRLDFLDGPQEADGEGGTIEILSAIIEVLDRPLADDDDPEDVDTDSDVDPSDLIGDDILNDPDAYHGNQDQEGGALLDELSSGNESADSDAEDARAPRKSAARRRADLLARQQESVRSIKKNVKKLDAVMQVLYEYLRRANSTFMGQGVPTSGYFDDVAPSAGSGSMGRARGAAISKKDRQGEDEDLLMVTGQMDEDELLSETSGTVSSQLGAGLKVRRVDSPVAMSASSGKRGSIPLFEPTPSPSPGLSPAALPSPVSTVAQPGRRTNLFYILLSIFDRVVLPTFRSRHVQFVMFWFSSLDAEYADTFLGMLLSKALYSGAMGREEGDDALHVGHPHSRHAQQQQQQQQAASPILRKAAASYVASLVSRASFIGAQHTRVVVLHLCAFLDAYLEQYTVACAHASASVGSVLSLHVGGDGGPDRSRVPGGPPAPGNAVHDVFYSIAQALFYIFCFRWRDLEIHADGDGGHGGDRHHQGRVPSHGREKESMGGTPAGPKSYASDSTGGAGTSLPSTTHASSIGSVAANYKTNGFESGAGAGASLAYSHSSSASGASSSGVDGAADKVQAPPHGGGGVATAAFAASTRTWCDGMDVVQRLITSALNPLRYCSPTVVRQFAYVAKVTGLVYCYSIIEANNRAVGLGQGQGRASGRGSGDGSGSASASASASVSMTASGTLQPLRKERHDTPTRASRPGGGDQHQDTDRDQDKDQDEEDEDEDDELPQPAGSDRLDGFFPFDPYRLQNSMGFVEGLYRQWEDVAPESHDDEDDDDTSDEEGDDDSDAASSTSSSDSNWDSNSDDEDGDEDGDDVEMDPASNRRQRRPTNTRTRSSPTSVSAMAIPTPGGARGSRSRRVGDDGQGQGQVGGEGGDRERFAQSFEAMSLSPNPGL